MNIFTIETEKDFLSIKDAWDTLFSSNKKLTLFQSWDFNYIWWKTFSKTENIKLKIICFGTRKKIKIIFPCFLDSKNCLKFLQDGFIDFPEIIYENNSDILSLIKKVSDYIKQDNSIKSVLLNNLKLNSPITNLFPYYFKNSNFFLYQLNQYSFIYKENYDDSKFCVNLTSKQRNELKKIDKTIITDFLILRKKDYNFPEKEINYLLKDLLTHHNRDKLNFEKIVKFLKELYNHDLIYFICHKIDNKTVSISAIVDLNEDEKLIWIDFYDLKIKKINLKNYIKLLRFTKNNFHLNLGTGNHDYKIKNFSPEIESLYTFYFSKSKIDFSFKMLKTVIARVLNLI